MVDNQQNKVTITAQVTNPSDNAEQLNMGAEYSFMDQFHLRTGYEFGQLERRMPSLGGGVSVPFAGRMLKADYAYTRYERLRQIHRIGVVYVYENAINSTSYENYSIFINTMDDCSGWVQ